MKLVRTELEGVFIVENFHSSDERGSFTKTYHNVFFEKNGLCTDFKESYFSVSKKNVIRGMHFQLSPYDHEKLVYVAKGEVIDVILDLRKSSKTYGKGISIVLNNKNHRSVYIPKGLAHGFRSMVDNTIMIYNVSTVYNNEADYGVRFDSFNFNWELSEPIVSERDKSLITFEEFNKSNPF
ncbi:MAG: dTDP-4-dehydrorhamnose 3,5-epimerase family protein [Vallitaleaceae bacterium]|nr:dTDP-4-dehydrorhamnose 3,5-epimerase family protein [Vallitaleaceae bacterium]